VFFITCLFELNCLHTLYYLYVIFFCVAHPVAATTCVTGGSLMTSVATSTSDSDEISMCAKIYAL